MVGLSSTAIMWLVKVKIKHADAEDTVHYDGPGANFKEITEMSYNPAQVDCELVTICCMPRCLHHLHH